MSVAARRHKYGARRTEYGGRKYASAAEARQAFELDVLKMAGKIVLWTAQPRIALKVNDIHVCDMVLDFKVNPVAAKGHEYYIEVKGFETAVYKLKLKLLKACYPDIDLRIVRA